MHTRGVPRFTKKIGISHHTPLDALRASSARRSGARHGRDDEETAVQTSSLILTTGHVAAKLYRATHGHKTTHARSS